MTRFAAALLSLSAFAAAPALAHPGHLDAVAGHSHWLGLAAGLGAVLLIGVALRVRRTIRARRQAARS